MGFFRLLRASRSLKRIQEKYGFTDKELSEWIVETDEQASMLETFHWGHGYESIGVSQRQAREIIMDSAAETILKRREATAPESTGAVFPGLDPPAEGRPASRAEEVEATMMRLERKVDQARRENPRSRRGSKRPKPRRA